MSKTADIIVIGGGIAGISAAARLAPEAKVVVLEAEPHLAYHSTGRSAATYILNYGNAPIRALNAASRAPLEGDLLGESVLSPRGMLMVAPAQDQALLSEFLDSSDGVQEISPAEAQAMVPALKVDEIASAAYEPNARDIDVDLLLQGDARQARDNGAEIVTSAPVEAAARQNRSWRVTTPAGTFEAPILVNASGAWADQVGAMAGAEPIGLQPLRRSAVIMPVPADMSVRNWPLFAAIKEDWYAKPDGDRLLISPADEDPVDPQDAWPDDMVLAEGLYRFESMVDVPIVKPSHSWAGLRSFVADKTPVCGFDPAEEGFFWLAGQGGYGVQTSPALSRLAADLILGKTPEIAEEVVAALSVDRLR